MLTESMWDGQLVHKLRVSAKPRSTHLRPHSPHIRVLNFEHRSVEFWWTVDAMQNVENMYLISYVLIIKHQKHGCVVYVSSNPVLLKSV